MDELEIKGGKYISSKRAAELTGYAADYVGQLARGGKVEATRVGRAWYVLECDVLKHAGSGHSPQEKPLLKAVLQERIGTVGGAPTRTLTSLRYDTHRKMLNTWGSVRYHPDENALIPTVLIKDTSHNIGIKKDHKNIAIPESRTTIFARKSVNHSMFNGISIVEHVKEVDTENLVHISQRPFKKQGTTGHSLAPALSPLALMSVSGLATALILAGLFFSASGISYDWSVSDSQVSNAYSIDFGVIFVSIETFSYAVLASFIVFFNTLVVSTANIFTDSFYFILQILNLG